MHALRCSVKLVQVGVGGFGRSWVDIVKASPDWEHAALVDVRQEALEQAAQAAGVPLKLCFPDLRTALDSHESDAVLIVTPPEYHAAQAVEATEAGKHVLTEKPIADTAENAEAMVAAAERAGRILMVSQNYRFRAQARTIADLVRRQELGELGYVGIQFHKAPRFEGSYRLKMDHPLLVDMSIHHFDLIRCLTGRDPVTIRAHTFRPSWSWFDHPPALSITITLTQGVVASYFGSWVSKGQETSWDADWRLQCADGAILWRDGRIRLAREGEDLTSVEPTPMAAEDRPYALREFAQAIDADREPETSGRDNLHSFGMVLAAIRSIETGEEVSLADVI